ncbi:unnamed protein product [Phytophthora fragariaefolia]|uniref:Unnamed protein product n=1 Tax=Phytophthora fragariaefolia TaxID=1490495 RepID=A0A9W7CVP7_9STRA|nr:unnamed protein product [Phytophthora fragariaefolia]
MELIRETTSNQDQRRKRPSDREIPSGGTSAIRQLEVEVDATREGMQPTSAVETKGGNVAQVLNQPPPVTQGEAAEESKHKSTKAIYRAPTTPRC